MAAVLKYWREAATLILVTGRHLGKNIKFSPVSTHNTLKIENANQNAIKGDNFEVMMLKRSSKSKFMPNLYVFPGGVASDADFSSKWKDIFFNCNADLAAKTFMHIQQTENRLPMFSREREAEFSSVPSELAFRICAIRETFEESGVLLARNQLDMKTLPSGFIENPITASSIHIDAEILEKWRKQVYADASQFITMCQELHIVPDIWSLYEWSNWLTPTGSDKFSRRAGRRYDTVFFVACINDKPTAIEDDHEAVHLQWGAPIDILNEYREDRAGIAPPQLYELSRLLNFTNDHQINEFIWKRESKGLERYFPVQIRCQDAYLSLLPGDDLYPHEPNCEEGSKDTEIDQTFEEINRQYPNHHRTYLTGDDKYLKLSCNIEMYGAHVSPLPVQLSDSPLPKL